MNERENQVPQIKSAAIGINRDEARELPLGQKKLAAETLCIFYKDKTAEIIDLSDIPMEQKEQMMDEFDATIKYAIKNTKNYITLYSDSRDFEKIYAKASRMMGEESLDKRNNRFAKIVVGAGAIGIAGMLTAAGISAYNSHKDKEEVTISDEKDKAENSKLNVDITGKGYEFYNENATLTSQKTSIVNIHNWLSKFGMESWTEVTLTEEQMKQYNITTPECVFGLTAEEALALSLRFGHYTNDEYVTLMGGSDIDVVSVIDSTNSLSNNAISSIISYYICSDECDLNIEQIINFNEKELDKIEEIELKLAEFKVLINNKGKEKEAFAKMQEIKKWFNEFAYTADPELSNAKSYVLRTMLPACSILSEIYQYKETIVIEAYDKELDKYTSIKSKTALFDELMMRNLVIGFDEFDEAKYLKENNISSYRYTLNLSDEPASIADKYCSDEIEKLNQANEYIEKLRLENSMSEVAFAGSLTVNLDSEERLGNQILDQLDNVDTKYDKLIDGTYEISELLDMLNDSLKKQGLYPQNINYFRTAKLSEIQIEYNKTQTVTQGKKGDKITVKQEQAKPVTNADLTAPNTTVVDSQGNQTTAEEAMEEAREENNKADDSYDYDVSGNTDAEKAQKEQQAAEEAAKSEAAAQRAAMLQSVYDTTYNYIYSGNSAGYDAGWASSSDSEVVGRHNQAVADAEERIRIEKEVAEFNNQQNNQTPVIDSEYKDAEMVPQQPSATPAPTEAPQGGYSSTPPTGYAPVVDDANANNSGNIIIDPAFQDADMTFSLNDLGLTEDEWNSIVKTKTI